MASNQAFVAFYVGRVKRGDQSLETVPSSLLVEVEKALKPSEPESDEPVTSS